MISNVVTARVEQPSLFPRVEISAELDKYPATMEGIWRQNERMNQSTWLHMRHHLQAARKVIQGCTKLPMACAGAGVRPLQPPRR